MKFHHLGISVLEKLPGMQFAECMKVWFTSPSTVPYNVEFVHLEPHFPPTVCKPRGDVSVEFVYFEPDSPMAAAVQSGVHVAYVVDDIEAAIKDKSVLWPITEVAPGLKIAFIYDGGLAVELMQMG